MTVYYVHLMVCFVHWFLWFLPHILTALFYQGTLNWTRVSRDVSIKNITVPDETIYQFAISANTDTQSSGMVWASCTVIHNKSEYLIFSDTCQNCTLLCTQNLNQHKISHKINFEVVSCAIYEKSLFLMFSTIDLMINIKTTII